MCDCADEVERQRKLAIEKKQQMQVETQRHLEKKQHERDLKQLEEKKDNVILERQIEAMRQERQRELEQQQEQTRVLVRTLEAEREQRRREIEGDDPNAKWRRFLYGCILLFGVLGFAYHKRCKIIELVCCYIILPLRRRKKPCTADVKGEEITIQFVGFVEDKPPPQKPCDN